MSVHPEDAMAMIEIRSRYDGGKVLYTAENASDVRVALQEAVAARANLAGADLTRANLAGANLGGADLGGADLTDAYLTGADLTRADLTDAYLTGADLTRADLTGAYLTGADLTRADLTDAYLTGADLTRADLTRADLARANLARANLTRANLTRANLAGADLTRANLARANLEGADLAGAIWEQVADALETALRAMNDSGRHWIKGALAKPLEDGTTAYCSVGSVLAASRGTVRAVALWVLASVTAGAVEHFNDHEGTTWDDIQAVFGVAIRNARRFAA